MSRFHELCGCFIMTKNNMADILVFELSILVKISISYGVLHQKTYEMAKQERERSSSFPDLDYC